MDDGLKTRSTDMALSLLSMDVVQHQDLTGTSPEYGAETCKKRIGLKS